MKINLLGETYYRFKLAEYYLKKTKKAYRRKDYGETDSFSQLIVESLAKTVIAFFRASSWSHDSLSELRELSNDNTMLNYAKKSSSTHIQPLRSLKQSQTYRYYTYG